MKDIVSFQIDHNLLKPGVYLHEIKDYGSNKVTTYDFRFKKPNCGDYLSPVESHTIEHIAATYFTNVVKDKVYWGPMGCLTGFYLVLNGEHNLEDVLNVLDGLDKYFEECKSNNYIPGQNPQRCGNYKMLDIDAGIKAWKDFYNMRDKWGKEYPIIK